MFGFKACFWNSDVYINENNRFDSNEILTAYLNDKHYNYLSEQDFIYYLKYFKRHLTVSHDMDYEDYVNYNSNVYKAISGSFDMYIKFVTAYLQVHEVYKHS